MPPRLALVCVLFSTATLLHAIGDTLITVLTNSSSDEHSKADKLGWLIGFELFYIVLEVMAAFIILRAIKFNNGIS